MHNHVLSDAPYKIYVKNFLHLLVTFLVIAVCRYNYDLNYKHDNFFQLLIVVFNILYILSFVSTCFSTQPQPLLVFLQSEAGSNNKRDKTKSCKHQSHEGLFVSKIDKYVVSFFLDDKDLKLSLLN